MEAIRVDLSLSLDETNIVLIALSDNPAVKLLQKVRSAGEASVAKWTGDQQKFSSPVGEDPQPDLKAAE